MSFSRLLGLVALIVGIWLTSSLSAHADWYRVTTNNFVVYGEGSARNVVNQAQQLERLDQLMRQALNVPSNTESNRLSVYIVGGKSELKKIWPTASDEISGFYTASANGTIATLIRGEDNHTLFHEYAHHFMMHYFPGSYPAWFVEGFAEYFGTANVRNPQKVSLGYFSEGRMYVLRSPHWMSIDRLMTASPQELGRNEGQHYYALSWLLTHYLMTDPTRKNAFSAYLSAIRRGADWKEALQTHAGRTPEQLTADLRSYFNGRMGYSEFPMQVAQVEPEVTRLSAGADDFIHLYAALHTHMSDEHGQTALATARAMAGRFADDPIALTVVASLEQKWGEDANAEAEIEQLLSLYPNHVDGLRLKAQQLIKKAEANQDSDDFWEQLRQAQTHLAKAIEIDPTDFRNYRLLAHIRSHSDTYPNDNDLDTLLTALDYAPQVSELRVQTANALLRAGKRGEATALMRVLRSQAHAPRIPDPTDDGKADNPEDTAKDDDDGTPTSERQ